jgi:Cytochrome P450
MFPSSLPNNGDWLSLVSGIALFVCVVFILRAFAAAKARWTRLQPIPKAENSTPLLGHLLALVWHPMPWEEMLSWTKGGSIVHWWLPGDDWLSVQGGEAMRTVLQTNFKDWDKETQMSFQPFLCILGTGLVTSHGTLWQQQRKLMTPAFKGDILTKVINNSVKAVERLALKIETIAASGSCPEMDEEFRLLTLQVCPIFSSNGIAAPAACMPFLTLHSGYATFKPLKRA